MIFKKLLSIRESRGETQIDAALSLRVSRQTYNAWENGKRVQPRFIKCIILYGRGEILESDFTNIIGVRGKIE